MTEGFKYFVREVSSPSGEEFGMSKSDVDATGSQ